MRRLQLVRGAWETIPAEQSHYCAVHQFWRRRFGCSRLDGLQSSAFVRVPACKLHVDTKSGHGDSLCSAYVNSIIVGKFGCFVIRNSAGRAMFALILLLVSHGAPGSATADCKNTILGPGISPEGMPSAFLYRYLALRFSMCFTQANRRLGPSTWTEENASTLGGSANLNLVAAIASHSRCHLRQ